MQVQETAIRVRRSVQTPSGRISYQEQGTGLVALFVHGVLLNGHLWRHQLQHLSDHRQSPGWRSHRARNRTPHTSSLP